MRGDRTRSVPWRESITSVPVTGLIAVTKSDKPKEGRLVLAHSLRGLSIVVGEGWGQEQEAAGHISPTVRKQS